MEPAGKKSGLLLKWKKGTELIKGKSGAGYRSSNPMTKTPAPRPSVYIWFSALAGFSFSTVEQNGHGHSCGR